MDLPLLPLFPEASRAAGLQRLDGFLPRAGTAYARDRNHDRGAAVVRGNVSMLSPFLRHRLVSEAEVIAAAVGRHGAAAGKFVEEVGWRSYWKGWLARRPGVWAAWRQGVVQDLAGLVRNPALAAAVEAAEAGRTGIDGFDHWAQELARTGYLHNHARMWFASIWIFTLNLPWRLGADLFMRRLIDADPASNTLSWRQVAGLHSRGKAYAARAANIHGFTDGRFNPAGQLNETPEPLDEASPPPAGPVPRPYPADPRLPALLVLTEDDGRPETLFDGLEMCGAVALDLTPFRAVAGPVAEPAAAFARDALADAATRLVAAGGPAALPVGAPTAEALAATLIDDARAAGARQIVLPHPAAGHAAMMVDQLIPRLQAAGLHLATRLRRWDAATAAGASHGYFRFRKGLPPLVELALSGGADEICMTDESRR